MVNRFRPFYSPTDSLVLSKPRFLLDGDGLRLLSNPTIDPRQLQDPSRVERELGPDDDWFFPGMFASGLLDTFEVARVARSAVYRQTRRESLRGNSRYPLYQTSPEGLDVVERVLIELDHEVDRNGATPVVVLFGGRRDSTDAAVRDIPEPYAPLLARLKENGIAVIDLADVIVPEVRRQGTDHCSPITATMLLKVIV